MSIMRRYRLVALGGLANRMRAIAGAMQLAALSGRELEVVWPVNWELKARFDELFEPLDWIKSVSAQQFALTLEHPRKRTAYVSAVYQSLMRLGGWKICYPDLSPTPELIEPTGQAAAMDPGARKVMISTCNEIIDYDSKVLSDVFRPDEAVRERIAQLESGFTGHYRLGVHIRRTDHIASMERTPLEEIEKEIDRCIAAHPEGIDIYLATDDTSVKRRYASRWPQIHFTTVEPSRRSVEGMREGAAEMWVLSSCQRIIGSALSSYSQLAARLKGADLTIFDSNLIKKS